MDSSPVLISCCCLCPLLFYCWDKSWTHSLWGKLIWSYRGTRLYGGRVEVWRLELKADNSHLRPQEGSREIIWNGSDSQHPSPAANLLQHSDTQASPKQCCQFRTRYLNAWDYRDILFKLPHCRNHSNMGQTALSKSFLLDNVMAGMWNVSPQVHVF